MLKGFSDDSDYEATSVEIVEDATIENACVTDVKQPAEENSESPDSESSESSHDNLWGINE